MSSQHDLDTRKAERAQRDLERVTSETDALGTSATARMANGVKKRFKAEDINQEDAIEVIGTRIGRGLGLIAFLALALYLFITYVLN